MENIRHELLLFSSTSTVSSTSSIILRHSARTKRYRHFFRAPPLFCESWMWRTEKNHHLQNLSCAPGVSLLKMGYIWNPNMCKLFRYQPRTYNQHAIWARDPNCWLPCGHFTQGTVLLQLWKRRLSCKFDPCKLLLHQSFVALRTNSFHCCDGQLFANLNCRVAKCAIWFTTPFYDCCQANVCNHNCRGALRANDVQTPSTLKQKVCNHNLQSSKCSRWCWHGDG